MEPAAPMITSRHLRRQLQRRGAFWMVLSGLGCWPFAGGLLAQHATATVARTRSDARPALPEAAAITVEGIFRHNEFASMPMPDVQWLKDGRSYVTLRPNTDGGGTDILRVDAATGATTVLVSAQTLVDTSGGRMTVESLTMSPDETKALVFHGSVRVWRSNTRGRYDVVDFATGRVTPLWRQSALQMFATFSPDGKSVAFVRDNNLVVTDLATGTERQLTTDGSAEIINGTSDWVYEEELGLREAYRWSPDSRRIVFWRFDQSAVPSYPLLDVLSLEPKVMPLRYPMAGQPNSSVRVGVLDVAPGVSGAPTPTWLDVGGDTGVYVTRMSWISADSLLIQRLPRRQNRIDMLVRSATTGQGRTLLTDTDSAYVDAREQPVWVNGGREFLWLSDRSGWRQMYLYSRSGALVRQVTTDGSDVLAVAGVDSTRGTVYVQEAAPDATQRQVYRYSLGAPSGNGRATGGTRVTATAGSHIWSVAPGARYTIDVSSRLADPPVASLLELPGATPVRVLVDNAALTHKLAALAIRPPDFIKVPMPDGTVLDRWRIVPRTSTVRANTRC